ncbi:ADP-ribosylation factor-like protein [Perkinsela sp. CCAP 1560/4]|nr:ADP-ribosylation factor-like protein [Perkinsela sp. CCAP 1560/4]|eukprot:KNH07322.1 ADP-ribosylation factor-like protein [Perkinsela sp. CCAP 1560/4]
MGVVYSTIKSLLSGEKRIEMCILGLENAGKTTLLNILSMGHALETHPTIGLNVKMIKKEGTLMKVWDLGGQDRFRGEWERYTRGSDCIIFCVDASAIDRLSEAKKELHRLLENTSLRGMPILVCLNKIDIEPHIEKEEAIKELNLDYITDNKWIVLSISALKQLNIQAVVEWMVLYAK